ncbi:hypothetical protein H9P43_006281 [Blastocladiella emersonii ATCC 22665]|nr:hypothetical protein H9P43_006281 [Blastocladiella emersonii ATCC 22665]
MPPIFVATAVAAASSLGNDPSDARLCCAPRRRQRCLWTVIALLAILGILFWVSGPPPTPMYESYRGVYSQLLWRWDWSFQYQDPFHRATVSLVLAMNGSTTNSSSTMAISMPRNYTNGREERWLRERSPQVDLPATAYRYETWLANGTDQLTPGSVIQLDVGGSRASLNYSLTELAYVRRINDTSMGTAALGCTYAPDSCTAECAMRGGRWMPEAKLCEIVYSIDTICVQYSSMMNMFTRSPCYREQLYSSNRAGLHLSQYNAEYTTKRGVPLRVQVRSTEDPIVFASELTEGSYTFSGGPTIIYGNHWVAIFMWISAVFLATTAICHRSSGVPLVPSPIIPTAVPPPLPPRLNPYYGYGPAAQLSSGLQPSAPPLQMPMPTPMAMPMAGPADAWDAPPPYSAIEPYGASSSAYPAGNSAPAGPPLPPRPSKRAPNFKYNAYRIPYAQQVQKWETAVQSQDPNTAIVAMPRNYTFGQEEQWLRERSPQVDVPAFLYRYETWLANGTDQITAGSLIQFNTTVGGGGRVSLNYSLTDVAAARRFTDTSLGAAALACSGHACVGACAARGGRWVTASSAYCEIVYTLDTISVQFADTMLTSTPCHVEQFVTGLRLAPSNVIYTTARGAPVRVQVRSSEDTIVIASLLTGGTSTFSGGPIVMHQSHWVAIVLRSAAFLIVLLATVSRACCGRGVKPSNRSPAVASEAGLALVNPHNGPSIHTLSAPRPVAKFDPAAKDAAPSGRDAATEPAKSALTGQVL